MLKLLKRLVLIGCVLSGTLFGSIASAQLVSNMHNPYADRQWFSSGISLGQSFTAPAEAASIRAIGISANVNYANVTLYIYGSDNDTGYNINVGNPDYVQTGIDLVRVAADEPLQRIELDDSFSMEPGETYRFYFASQTDGISLQITTNSQYADGDMLTYFYYPQWPKLDLVFQIWGDKSQRINFNNNTPSEALVNQTFRPAAVASSRLPVAISIAAESADICSLAAGIVRFDAAGTCLLLADQAGNDEYLAADQASHSITVRDDSLVAQEISFTSTPPADAVVGGSYWPAATSTSGLPVSLTIAAASVEVCSISGSEMQFDAVGTCTVLADQAGDSAHLPAAQVEQSFAIASAPVPVATATPVPALGVYSTMALAALMGAIGIATVRRPKASKAI